MNLYCSANYSQTNSVLSLALATEFGDLFYAELNNKDLVTKSKNVYIDKFKTSLCFLKNHVVNHTINIIYSDIDADKLHNNIFLKNHSNVAILLLKKWIAQFNAKEITLVTDLPLDAFITSIAFGYRQEAINNKLLITPLVYMCREYFKSICNITEENFTNNPMNRALLLLNQDLSK